MIHRPPISLLLCALLPSAIVFSAGQTVSGSPRKTVSAAKGAVTTQKTGENTDACALLTRAEIQVVQNEPVEETKPSAQSGGSFLMSQCFFRTATAAKSVSLAMATPDSAKPSALTPREYWKKQFHPPEQSEKEKENDEPTAGKAKTPKETEEEHEKELSKPRVIDGLGEEAYWVGNLITGALYVLKGEVFLRISVGGVRDESERIEKSKKLARAALGRF